MKNKKPFTLKLYRPELILGWIYLLVQFLLLPIPIVLVCYALGVYSDAVVNLIYYVINAICCTILFRRVLTESLYNVRQKLDDFLHAVILGFLGYYLSAAAIGGLIMVLWPDFSNVNDAAISAMIEEFPVLMPLAVVTLVPIAEECLFRGLVFIPLAWKNPVLGYVVTTLAFASIHVVGYIGSYDAQQLAIGFLQYLPSVVLCWACRKSDGLCAPIIIHALVNTVSLFATR